MHNLFWIIYDIYEGWKSKATINNKVREIKQVYVLDPVK